MVFTRSQALNPKHFARGSAISRSPLHRSIHQLCAPSPSRRDTVTSEPSPRGRGRHGRSGQGRHSHRLPKALASTMTRDAAALDEDQDLRHPTAGQMLYGVMDVVLELLTYADWPTLMAFSRTASAGRGCVQFEVRVRVRMVVTFFISRDDLNRFFDELDAHNVLIVGSTVRNLFYMNLSWCRMMTGSAQSTSHPLVRPRDLNLIVPRGHQEAMVEVLEIMGYGGWTNEFESLHYEGVLRSIVRGFKIGSVDPVRA
jgi:hypothetical protein